MTGTAVSAVDELTSVDHTSSPDSIQRRFEEDGAFVFRELFDAEDIRRVRVRLMRLLRNSGWIADGTEDAPQANLRFRCADPDISFLRTYRRVITDPAIHAFPHSDIVNELAGKLGIREVFHLPRIVLRMVFPGAMPTPPHQDWSTVQGSRSAVTCWVPLVDCDLGTGPVSVITGSHTRGEWPRRRAPGIGGEVVDTGPSDRWSSSDVEVGDAVVFRGLTVHRALPNTGNVLRLSLDFRMQDASDVLHPGSIVPPDGFRSWDDVYSNWTGPERRNAYYWRGSHPPISPSAADLERAISRAENADKKFLGRMLQAVNES
jgi:ectoine hydroxylase-related dioxygenase (phytanoyl-CoA dioxygenase family)